MEESLLSLTASLLRHYGGETPHPSLPRLDALLEKGFRNVAVLLFDGMGESVLREWLPADAFLRRHEAGTLSSVFPPTTVAATTTLMTGLSPIEHGWLGWNLFFPEIGDVSVFSNTLARSGGKKAADYPVAERLLPCASIFDKIRRASGGTADPRYLSPYAGERVGSVGDICRKVREICREPGRHYLYAYWPEPDAMMHRKGTRSPEIGECLREIDRAAEELCAGLSDTLVLITADHGLVDVRWAFLRDTPDAADCLLRPPSLEARALSFFVKPGRKEEFREAFLRRFGGDFRLYSREEVFSRRLFGEGTPHPRTADFLGDFLAVAQGALSLDWEPPRGRPPFAAAHAGGTEEERRVPFVCIET